MSNENVDILVFKKLKKKNVIVTPFKTNKSWTFTDANYSSSYIIIASGSYDTGIGTLGFDMNLEPT